MSRVVPAVAEAELPEGGKLPLVLGGWPVLLCRSDGELHAVINRCPHQAATLDPGRVRRGFVICPLHGARFELASGKCAGGAYADLTVFPVSVEDGVIQIAVPDEPPLDIFKPVL